MKDIVTESRIPYNTIEVEKVTNGVLKCTKKSNFELPAIKTVFYILESVRYLGPKVWNLVPDKLKKKSRFYKKNVKCLEFKNLRCNLCRKYYIK